VTTIAVDRAGGRHVVRHIQGLLRAQVVASGPERCRIGLLATTALLLGGDVVELDVRVGPGARLDLFDVAGTVAYHGRGVPSAWHVRLEVGAGAGLTVRDTIVLGRSGQVGGRLRSLTAVRRGGRSVLLEDQRLDPDRWRTAPGMLGTHRVLDTLLRLGPVQPEPVGATTYALVDRAGTLTRWLGTSLADSPLHGLDLQGADVGRIDPAVLSDRALP
jgi:urease accessory protein